MLTGVVAPACSPLRISSQRADAVLCRNPRVYLCLPHRCCATKSCLSRIPAVPYYHSSRPSRPIVIAGAADSTPPVSTSAAAASGKAIVPDEGFSLSKSSFGVIGLVVGGSLLLYGFGAYFSILPGSEWSALMLTYGFPLAIIGMALKYAELKPVPCITYSDAQDLRETCATPVLKQVRNDVTRFRYGDEQHLDEALKRIFQYGQGSGISRRNGPILQMIREEVIPDNTGYEVTEQCLSQSAPPNHVIPRTKHLFLDPQIKDSHASTIPQEVPVLKDIILFLRLSTPPAADKRREPKTCPSLVLRKTWMKLRTPPATNTLEQFPRRVVKKTEINRELSHPHRVRVPTEELSSSSSSSSDSLSL
ncbi:hypothetical protein AXF42_Ash017190 [Apostasia shenzhenica]|uniref:Thylakoid membrane protein slr0575 n=1 Tax=Apostasia shenzhenica TaxID=1088818 RepID=A0A2H9ZVB1_9ASPA|nr:hypothetical protein AXF42_Ash017190 [Apostasia shenzhenica]